MTNQKSKNGDGDRPSESGNDRDERAVLQAHVQIKQSDTQMFNAIIYDLSVSGFRLSCFVNLIEHKPVYLKIPGLKLLTGNIRWVSDNEYGCMFYQPLSPYVFEHIVSRMQS